MVFTGENQTFKNLSSYSSPSLEWLRDQDVGGESRKEVRNDQKSNCVSRVR